MDTFTVYEPKTGRIIKTDVTETQALNIAAALRVYGGVNVSVQATGDVEGGNVHKHYVRFDQF